MNRNTDAQNLHITANDGKPMLAAVFLLLIFSTLENNSKISLKKFANSKKRCIFVSTKR